ncbi:MAG: hypothetical protein AAF789_09660 [Bacteroidota bacterium]
MKTIKFLLTIATFCTSISLLATGLEEQDTVILELENKSKIMIITPSKDDLANLEKYDINQMIKDLNAQLSDSVTYLEINDGTNYAANGEESNWTQNDEKLTIKLGGMEVGVDPDEVDDWDEDDWYNRKREDYDVDRFERTISNFNIDLGTNNWLEDNKFPDQNGANYAVKPFGSWYVALNSVNSTAITGPLFLDWGIGVSWYNWKLQDPDFLLTDNEDEGQVEFRAIGSGFNGEKSKLTASFLNVSVVPMLDFSRGRKRIRRISSDGVSISTSARQGFRFGVGGYAGYRLGSHTKIVFEENGDRKKERERDNFYLQNFRYGIRAQIGWKGLDFFGMYDINEVFSSNRGPQLNAITFGITL